MLCSPRSSLFTSSPGPFSIVQGLMSHHVEQSISSGYCSAAETAMRSRAFQDAGCHVGQGLTIKLACDLKSLYLVQDLS